MKCQKKDTHTGMGVLARDPFLCLGGEGGAFEGI